MHALFIAITFFCKKKHPGRTTEYCMTSVVANFDNVNKAK